MIWRVIPGRHVTHDGRGYAAGEAVPMTDAQGLACSGVECEAPRAVEPDEPVQMKAEVPATAAVTKKRKQ